MTFIHANVFIGLFLLFVTSATYRLFFIILTVDVPVKNFLVVFVLLANQIPELWEPESIMTASTVGAERNLGLDNSSATCPVERGVKTLLKTNKNALSSANNSSIPVCMRQYILEKGYKCSPLLRIRTQNSYFIVLSSCFIKLIHCATEFFRNNSFKIRAQNSYLSIIFTNFYFRQSILWGGVKW